MQKQSSQKYFWQIWFFNLLYALYSIKLAVTIKTYSQLSKLNITRVADGWTISHGAVVSVYQEILSATIYEKGKLIESYYFVLLFLYLLSDQLTVLRCSK